MPTYFFDFLFFFTGRTDGGHGETEVCVGLGMYTLLSPKSRLYAGVELGSARLQLKKSTQGPKLGAGHDLDTHIPHCDEGGWRVT